MFDIGFWELIIIGVVALLVVGPERLPELASFIGRWVGRGRRFMDTVRADVEKEVATHNLNKILGQGNKDTLEIIDRTREEFKEIADTLNAPLDKDSVTPPEPKPEPDKDSAAPREPKSNKDSAAPREPKPDH